MHVPVSVATLAGAISHDPLRVSATADGTGVAVATCPQVPDGWAWQVGYAVVSSTSSAGPACTLYDTVRDSAHLWDGTSEGAGAVAAYSPPRVLPSGSQLLAVWTGCAAGDSCTLRLEYIAVRV